MFRGMFVIAGYPLIEVASGLIAAVLASRWYWRREFASYVRYHGAA
jgi:hypothetical protein